MKGVGFKLCESDRVRFWFDDWMGMGLLHVLFPRVFRIASNKESSVRDCYVGMGCRGW